MTFGRLVYRDGFWVVRAEPDAMVFFRRLFPRSKRDGQDVSAAQIKDSPTTARDLAWFMDRFPLTMSTEDRQRLYTGRTRQVESERYVAGILAGTELPRPFDLALPARDYQAVAAEMALRTGGLLCADQVGLGKTVCGLATLADPQMRPALCVVETQLQLQWQAQIGKFLPRARTHILKQGKPYPLPVPAPDILICNYEKLDGWADVLAPVVVGVVFDEVQALRHHDTNKYRAARHVSEHAKVRLGLSGTPIHNYGGEMYNIAEILRPGALGTREEFTTSWCDGVDERGRSKVKDPRALQAHLKRMGLMLRRTCKDVGREVPPLFRTLHQVQVATLDLTRTSRSATALDYARQLLASGSTPLQRLQAGGQLDAIMRQATGVAKAPGVADLAKLVLEEEQRIVIAAHHHAVHDLISQELQEYGVMRFTGKEGAKEKARAVELFGQRNGPRVLLMAIRAGAGLDGLQYLARVIIHAELDWSPVPHHQLDGRLARDGQAESVHSIFAVTTEGSDPIVLDTAGVKMGQIDGLLSADDADGVFEHQTDPDKLRRLAQYVLERAGKR